MVQDTFAVDLKLPCLEAGLAVDQPPLGVIVRPHRLVASAVFRIVCVKRLSPRYLVYRGLGFVFKSGTVLSCQDLVVQVLLPQWVLTTVFGMGTGGSPTP